MFSLVRFNGTVNTIKLSIWCQQCVQTDVLSSPNIIHSIDILLAQTQTLEVPKNEMGLSE